MVVLATLLMIVILANVVLNLMSSQARLTHHQVSRIQAYYAAQAGIVLATEKMRIGAAGWTDPAAFTKRLCRSAGAHAFCGAGGVIIDSNLPPSILYVNIDVGALNSGLSNTRKVSAVASYTYTPSS